jgi:ribosome-associated toxin RatA of RatAB toxin-antitoxin module
MISRKIMVKATPLECFKVISDFKNYPKFLEDIKKIKISKPKGKVCDVTYTLSFIREVTYTLRTTVDDKKLDISWEFVEGDYMRDNHGFWEFKEIRKGETQVTYHIDIQFGFLVPGFVSKMLAEQQLPKMLKALKERIER